MTSRYTQKVEENSYTGLITPFPGTSDVAVSHGVYKMSGNKSLGEAANIIRCKKLAEEGYSVVVAFVDDNNFRQQKILEHCGWVRSFSFFNKRTKNTLSLWSKQL
jgi:hypothetical protein